MKAFRQPSFLPLMVIALVLPYLCIEQTASGQNQKSASTNSTAGTRLIAPKYGVVPLDKERVSEAIGVICSERTKDPYGSIPIDEMQARPSIELTHPDSINGTSRARRLLPQTRELVAKALRELGKKYEIPEWRINTAVQRIQQVTKINPDPDLRDNAAVIMSEPDTISFGTIFLAGLRSDEGMISVLAHEMTHLADGSPNTLQPLFRAIGTKASALLGMRVTGQRAEELTCDLIGMMVARYLAESKPGKDTLMRRLSRSLQHNCVEEDVTDEAHLSPRTTMRAIVSLDSRYMRDLVGLTSVSNSPASQTPRSDFIFSMKRGSSLTISRADSYYLGSQ